MLTSTTFLATLIYKTWTYTPFTESFSFISILPTSLFLIGIAGIILNRRNLITLLLSLELVLLAANLNFIFISLVQFNPTGQIFSLLILTVAAAESAIGLGILIVLFRLKRDVSFNKFAYLRG